MRGSAERVASAFAHRAPDRTPLFEMFQQYHPIHWELCGRTVATDEALCWDALADGISWEELTEEDARAFFAIARYFELDIVHIPPIRPRELPRPVKLGPGRWRLDGVHYALITHRLTISSFRQNGGLACRVRFAGKLLLAMIGLCQTPRTHAC